MNQLEEHFDSILQLIGYSENILELKKIELNKKVEKEIKNLEWDESGYNSGMLFEIENEFDLSYYSVQNYLLSSTYILSFNLFETSLRILFCKLIRDNSNVEKSKIYFWKFEDLVKKFKTDFAIDFDEHASWKTINNYREIRNALTHRNCEIMLKENTFPEENATYIAVRFFDTNIVLSKDKKFFKINSKEFIINFKNEIIKFYTNLEPLINITTETNQ